MLKLCAFMVKLYIIGLSILVIAILANGIIGKIGLLSWYDFINLLIEKGTSALKEVTAISYLWLFIGYPLVLGTGYLVGEKLYNLLT